MTDTYLTEIYREKRTAPRHLIRVVSLSVDAMGSVSLDAMDASTNGSESWGDDDHEFRLDVPATALHKLVFALLREKYFGNSEAVDEFNAFCANERIEHKLDRRGFCIL